MVLSFVRPLQGRRIVRIYLGIRSRWSLLPRLECPSPLATRDSGFTQIDPAGLSCLPLSFGLFECASERGRELEGFAAEKVFDC